MSQYPVFIVVLIYAYLTIWKIAHDEVDRVSISLELREREREKRVRDQLRSGQQRVQVEPLRAKSPDRQPVLPEVADERAL